MSADIHDIIDNANDFVVVCGYNFSPYNNATSIIPKLIAKRNAGLAVLIIMPPAMWGFGNTSHSANIQYLLNNGIGVILNSNNHSKWMLSDHGYYYGSLNFTNASMTSKVEVISICNTLRTSSHIWWMDQTKQELLKFALSELNNFNSVTSIQSLRHTNTKTLATLRLVLGLILRFNPEIEKVETTLNNYEQVKQQLCEIVDNYFPLVQLTVLDQIWNLINQAVFSLDSLAFIGNGIILKHQDQTDFGSDVVSYNAVHTQFLQQINGMISYFELQSFESIIQEGNISLTRKAEDVLQENLE